MFLPILIGGLIFLTILYNTIYNLFFSPLRTFPGPKLWAISRLPYVLTLWSGNLHLKVKELHDQYGTVVRLAPDELSYIDATAWRDIYSGGNNNKGFPKNSVISGAQGFYSLTDSTDVDHTRFRGAIQKSFSAQALQARESTFQRYTDFFIRRLSEQVDEAEKKVGEVNIVEYLNWTTFDITGELTFSESFGCLEGKLYDPWIAMIFSHLKASALLIGLRFYKPLDEYLMSMIPKHLSKQKDDFIRLSKDKVHRRIDFPPEGKLSDFMTTALNNLNQADGMTMEEIEGTFTTLIIGGSETTATSIAGITSYLCRYPAAMKLLTDEIRALKTPGELNLVNLGKLPYLNAVINEGLRLCTPLPAGLPRIVPAEGAYVSGKWVAGGTGVAVGQHAAYRSARNFTQPDDFMPERWLAQPPFPNDNTAVFQPFFVGGRNCLGQNIAWAEMRLVLAKLFWHFDVEAVESRDWTLQKTYFLWQKEAFPVRLRRVERE